LSFISICFYFIMTQTIDAISQATDLVCAALKQVIFSVPVTHVYNPLEYARKPHQTYIERFARSEKRVLFLGMNPGPWGMAQTGIPFGEVAAVKKWIRICEEVGKPAREHPKRPIEGFACNKSEVSGRRLWGLFSEQFPDAKDFFREHYVVNYCPLVWMEQSGRNRTPDKIPAGEMSDVYSACDKYVRSHLEVLRPAFAIGVGGFAEMCFRRICEDAGLSPTIGKILHPSPASPAANRNWSGTATKQLRDLGVWP
jgi:single-strand selective monofunctional uracil DNA glycosylase